MKPCPATASQEKSHVKNWRSKREFAPLMLPTKFPNIPVSLERKTSVFLSRETGISGNFVGRIKGAKCPFDLQFLTRDFS